MTVLSNLGWDENGMMWDFSELERVRKLYDLRYIL